MSHVCLFSFGRGVPPFFRRPNDGKLQVKWKIMVHFPVLFLDLRKFVNSVLQSPGTSQGTLYLKYTLSPLLPFNNFYKFRLSNT